MDALRSIREGLSANLSIVARLFVAIIAVVLLLQLLVTIVSILRGIIQFHFTILKILVLWPARILISILCVPFKLLILVSVLLAWAVRSVARGVMALLMLLGLYGGRHLRVEPVGSDGNLPVVNRQDANLPSIQEMGVVGFGGHVWRVHVLLPGTPDRGGNNVGVIVGGMDGGGAGAWQAATLGRDGLVAQGSATQRWITAQREYTRTQGRP